MRVAPLTAVGVLLFTSLPVGAQAPPVEVLRGIESAGRFTETFVGSYRLVVNAVVSKTNGSDPQTDVSEMMMTRNPDGTQVETIVRASKNGKDTTAEARDREEKRKAKAEKRADGDKKGKADSDGELSVGLGIPTPRTVEHFTFVSLPAENGACRARYAPTREHRKDEGISRGEMAWQCDSLAPLWVTSELVDPPTGVSEMKVRMDLASAGQTPYMARLTTEGVGGILFIKRRFHMVMEISDVTPSTTNH